MRILLLGGTGNLGLRCIPALLAHNHTLTVYIRNIPKLQSLISLPLLNSVTIVQGDATDSASIKKALIEHDIEGIVDVAGNQVFPWQEFLLPKIAKAVCEAAVEVGAERGGKPLRVWITGGMGELEYPGTGGHRLGDYFFKWGMAQHAATRSVVESYPLASIRWSLLCVAMMHPANPTQGLFEPLPSPPPPHNLILQATSPPAWKDTWVSRIPLLGKYIDLWGVILSDYGTKYEDVADFVAGSFEEEGEGEEWIGMRVGMKDKEKA